MNRPIAFYKEHTPLVSKEIKPVNLKGNQPWIFIGRTDAEAETPILWPPDAKDWLIGKDSDAGKDRGQEEKGATENEMVGWHQWLNGQEFEQTLGDSEGEGSLVCCKPWSHRVGYYWVIELNWTRSRNGWGERLGVKGQKAHPPVEEEEEVWGGVSLASHTSSVSPRVWGSFTLVPRPLISCSSS